MKTLVKMPPRKLYAWQSHQCFHVFLLKQRLSFFFVDGFNGIYQKEKKESKKKKKEK